MKTDPDPSAAVLIDGSGLVARQALGYAVIGECAIAEAVQAAIHAHPEITLRVLIDGAHPISSAELARGLLTKRSPSSRDNPPLVPTQRFPSRSSQIDRTR